MYISLPSLEMPAVLTSFDSPAGPGYYSEVTFWVNLTNSGMI